ncbi:uncharacterized protein C8Q71DRAFT_710714 [Rhodofomes roseus]|uniref:Histone-lysine N-methyltransferase, H3 lysine-4 specific n=1 Tax=Rhodofomes roseus TaxID=34475 RepID=A0ABQ8KC00_9APHY|nr:uncharacterized protein C8Q71DRAFT_710714 [Rhodofomes roseus]KAH9834957.1 hypothetical protein C8Q71DRAFT_710714 [Rhodofomes roseus]
MDQGEEARVKGKGNGKEIVIRYNGEVIEGEHPTVLRDPRREVKVKRKDTMRPVRVDFVPIKYEHDTNSTGPPLPTAVLVLNLSPLTPNSHIRRCFSIHGIITSFEPQIDKTTGAALGIVYIKYSTHAEARKCVEKENGKKLTALNGVAGGGEEMVIVLDGEGKKLQAILKGLSAQKRKAQEEKRRKEREKAKETGSAKGTPSTTAPHTPLGSVHSSRPPAPWQKSASMRPAPASAKLPPKPVITPMNTPEPSTANSHLNGVPTGPKGAPPAPVRKVAPSTFRARLMSISKYGSTTQPPSLRPPLPASESSSSTPLRPWARRGRDGHDTRSRSPSRSPSPVMRRPGQSSKNAYQKDHEIVLEALAKNGFEHVTLDGHGGQLGSAVREEDVRQFFQGFRVDKILRDRLGWYVTFETSDSARRAAMVLNHGSRTLASRSVNVTVHPAPAPPSAPARKRWTDGELVDEATSAVAKELRALLEKDLLDKVVSTGVQKLVLEERVRRAAQIPDGEQETKQWGSGLRGLSFKKQRKRPREERETPSLVTPQPDPEVARSQSQTVSFVEEPAVERPRKRQKKVMPKKAIVNDDVESEDEDQSLPATPLLPDAARKRSTSEVTDAEEPVKKRLKAQSGLDDIVPPPKKVKKAPKKPIKKVQAPTGVQEIVHEVLPDDFDFDVPEVAQVRITPTPHYDSSVSPLASPSWKKVTFSTREHALPDPFDEGICEDDEDLYFAKLALARDMGIDESELEPSSAPAPDPDAPPPFRIHVTGSARTEGYYKISHAEKSAYVAQYASRGTVNEVVPEKEQQPQQSITSSRSNRANARRRAQGLEEINQVQRAMALSKGESAATELIKFNQLQTRKKHLRFARSPIHDWGLYAMERISRGEMVIEYVGEIIRAQVADKREKAYERQGIGSSYLFRIDEDLVVDATKKGNLGRLINHSCEPNCTARIITINGEKKIVIYAKQDIELGNEITYDYHFPIEQDKIPCLCGSAKCRGFLN